MAVVLNIPVREKLLDAAEEVVARDGVKNLTLDAVAREAGVSKGGLLYHFSSKQALVTGVVARLVAHCETSQSDLIADEAGEPGAAARAYLRARTECGSADKKPLHIALLVAAGTDPQLLAPMQKKLRDWQAALEDDGIDPVTASIVRLAADGLCLSELLGLPVPAEKLRGKIIERLLKMSADGTNVERSSSKAGVEKRIGRAGIQKSAGGTEVAKIATKRSNAR